MDGRKAAATLGVGPRATRGEIRRAFRARVKRAHPDAGGSGSEEAFIELRAAFDALMATAPERGPEPAPVASRSGPWATADVGRPPIGALDVVDVVDVLGLRRSVATARRPRRRPVRRDRRGRSFDDHLAAALAAAPASAAPAPAGLSRPGTR